MAVLAVLGVPAAVFAAAFAGLRLVARTSDEDAKGRWRDAVVAWTEARDALRKARTERKKAAAELAAEKRRLKSEQKTAEKPQSSTGDPAHAAVLAETRRAVAVQALEDKEEDASRRRDALAAARDKLRDCATASCRAWRRGVLAKSRRTVQRAWRKGFKQLWNFLCEYMDGWLSAAKIGLKLLKDYHRIAASVVSLGLPLITVFVDLLYYRNFHLNALPFYTSESLPALASTALLLLVVIAFSFVVFLLVVAAFFLGVRTLFGVRTLYWLLILAAASLRWTLLVVLSPLPLLVSRSALCARLAAPGPESEAR